MIQLKRYTKNPILTPIFKHDWESKAVLNPAAIYLDKKVHIIYRSMSQDNTSFLGYASSKDGVTIDERLPNPIYIPRIKEERKAKKGNTGCEDPRIVQIGDRLYMTYTAFDGIGPTRVALTSISVEDFIAHKWNWASPKLISPPGIDDKNACVLPEKINNKYAIFHRIYPCIWIDFVDDLDFSNDSWIRGRAWFKPRTDKWDSRKIGIAGPPIKTDIGWLLLYHGISSFDRHYRIGAMLLQTENPTQVISHLDYPILEPRLRFELEGQINNVVFPCGSVVINNTLYVYYGGADSVIGVAACSLSELLRELLANKQ